MPDGLGGSTTFKEREILVQHLLVPEDQLQLLLELQRKVMQGLHLSKIAISLSWEVSTFADDCRGIGMMLWFLASDSEGVDLSDLATEHSICASKSEGGMLGWIALGRTVSFCNVFY